MHSYNRLPSSGHSTPSLSPRLRHRQSKAGKFYTGGRSVAQRLSWMLLSVLLRRQGVFLFTPLIYISDILLYMGTTSFDVVSVIKHRPTPGSLYRSPQLYANFRHDMDSDNSSADVAEFFEG